MAKKAERKNIVATDKGSGSLISGDPAGLRKTGIELIGDVPWGTHFCQFYQTEQDLIETLVPYFKAGLESNEFCMWVTSDPLGVEDAKQALRSAVPDLDRRLAEGQIEILPHTDWYLKGGEFDRQRVLDGWVLKLNEALAKGYAGLRLTGNTFWLEKDDWADFTQYEEAVNSVIGGYRMLAVCTYSLEKCGAGEVADVVANHEFALMKRRGEWTVIESSTVRQAKQALQSAIGETQSLNEELRAEVDERKRTEDSLRGSEERYHTLFRSIGEGFALHEIICDDAGKPVDYRFLEINEAFERLTGIKREKVIGNTVLEVLPGNDPFWVETYGKVALTGEPATFENYNSPLGKWFEVYAFSPARGQFAVLFAEITGRKRREQELDKLNRTLKAHNNSSHAMTRATDEIDYLDEICRIVVEDCGHAMVWIGYAEDDECKSVRPVAYSGFEVGYLETLGITWADTERGRGPTGAAVRTGRPSMCRNMLTDPQFEPWREEALKRGYASSIAFPLMAEGKAFGAITIYSREPDPFSEDEISLLSGLADDLAYGVQAIRLRAQRERAEEAQLFLLQCGWPGSGEDFFQSLARYLAAKLSVDFVCIDRLVEGNLSAETVAVYVDGKFEDNLVYTLKETPCGDVVGKTVCTFPAGVRHLFPQDVVLQDMMAEGYVGTTLWSSQGQPVGMIALISRKPLENVKQAESLLQLVAIRAAGELERKQAEEALAQTRAEAERRAAELESFIASVTDGVLLLDSEGNVVVSNQAAIDVFGAHAGRSLTQRMSHAGVRGLDGSPLRVEETTSHRALRGESISSARCVVRSPQGDRVIEFSSAPVRTADGRVIGAATIFRDVTDKHEFERQREELLEREHYIAEMLQQALIPPSVPAQIGGFRIGVRYQAALRESEVGGDFYDVFDLGNGKIGVLIGDVAGKGLPAAIRVAAARYSVRSYAFVDPRPSHVLTLANQALCKDVGDEAGLLTVFFAVIDTSSARVTYASAGHEPPLLCRASGVIEELCLGGMLLGVVDSTAYTESTVDLRPGDAIVMVTDGITEARAPGSVLFQKKGMVEYLSNNAQVSPDETADGLLKAATAHAGGRLQDDAAVVVVRLCYEEPRRPELDSGSTRVDAESSSA